MAEVSQSTVSAHRGGELIRRTVRSIAMFAVALVVASAAVVSTGVLPASAASTGPGSLDTSFNAGGVGANGQVSSMVVQSDGKVLIVGDFTSYNGASVGRVARVNVDGSLDTTFNSGGAGANYQVSAVVVQSNGKILIGGGLTTYNGTSVGRIARLNADGSLDTTFNPGDVGANGMISSIIVLSNDKILVGGAFTTYNGMSVGRLARLNTDGSLDTAFNSGGTGASDMIFSMVVQPDGRAVIGGWFVTYNGAPVGRVARLNADGSLDSTFNPTGTGTDDTVNSVGVQPDGKLVISGGFTTYNGASMGHVARLNTDGSLDTTFNSGGSGADDTVTSVSVQPDGKLVMGGGFTRYDGTPAGYIARLNADGSLDSTFNSGGSGANSWILSVLVQPDGKLLIAGFFTNYDGTSAGYVARLNASSAVYTVSFDANGGSGSMASQSASSATALTANTFTRSGYTFTGWNTAANGSGTAYADGASFPFTADATLYAQWSLSATTAGALDTTFNSGGSGASGGQVSSIAVQSNGKILIGGSFTSFNGTAAGRIARLNADGSLDASFNAGGAGADSLIRSVGIQPDGKILIGGAFTNYDGASVGRVARLNADGSLDLTFNSGGSGADNLVFSLGTQSDGRILLGGWFTTYNGASVGRVARLNADGSLDLTFNSGGSGASDTVYSLGVQSDGKVLIGGAFMSYNGTSVGRVARLNADGSLDATFTSGGSGANDAVASVGVQSDGKVLTGGVFTSYNGTAVGRVARLNADGSLDATFNSGGSGASDTVYSVGMQSDGKVLIDGGFTSYNGAPVGRVARLNADGSLDSSFNSGGAGANSWLTSIAVQPDDKILIGGALTSYNGLSATGVARLYAAVPHTVVFDANGGSGSMASQSASTATALAANTLTRSGYTFSGWNTAADGSGTAYADQASFPFIANATLYAQWAPVSHTVSFDANGGSGSMASQSASSATALSPNAFTRSGYTFSGWNTAADGSGTAYADGASFPFTADATLYAQWAVVSHTVSFDANGGSGSMASQSASSATALSANTLTRSGYTFSGWNTAADGSGTAYADQASFPFTASATLYAQWVAVSSPVPSATLPQLQVTLGLALGQPVTGGSVSMSATGLLPGSSWQAVVRSTPVTMASGVVLSDGTFASTGVLPGGLEAGTHSVTLTATSALGAPVSSVVWFQVSAAGTLLAVTRDSSVAAAWVLPTGSLANTGSDSVDGLMLGTLLLIAGGLLLVLRRRRKVTA